MATYTPNYGLHQWVPEDKFLRTDFNEDFSKIDTALAGQALTLEQTVQRAAEHRNSLGNLAYPIFLQAAKDYDTLKSLGSRQVIFLDTFDTADYVASMTGEMRVTTGVLSLPTGSDPATMTTIPIDLTGVSWSRVIAWVRCTDTAEYILTVNGAAMTQTGAWSSESKAGTKCTEIQYEADAPGSDSVVFSFSITPHEGFSGKVYGYGALFL